MDVRKFWKFRKFPYQDCSDKYHMYRNCSAIPKFPEFGELLEITQKLRKETKIPVKTPEIPKKNGNSGQNFKISSFTWSPSYTQRHLYERTSLIWIYVIYVHWLEFPGVLTRISVCFQNFRVISGNSGNFVLISVNHFH